MDSPSGKSRLQHERYSMTVDKIRVRDFQSIAKAEVSLGKFTTFTGPSSSGKSAFLRACHALVRNSFSPTQVRQGKTVTEVAMEVDGHTISAIRGKSKSTYVLDEEEYTKSGRSVPDPILDILKMDPITEVDTSFAGQFDKPYLIADPGSIPAKVLGTLTNVSVLHAGMREANRRKLSVNASIKLNKEHLDKYLEDSKQFENLDSDIAKAVHSKEILSQSLSIQEETKHLERLSEGIKAKEDSLLDTESRIIDLEPLENLRDRAEDILSSLNAVSFEISRVDRAKSSLPTWDYLSVPAEVDVDTDLILDMNVAIKRIEKLSSEASSLKIVKIPDHSGLSKVDDLTELNSVVERISGLSLQTKELCGTIQELNDKEAKAKEELDHILKGIDVCPLCNSELS